MPRLAVDILEGLDGWNRWGRAGGWDVVVEWGFVESGEPGRRGWGLCGVDAMAHVNASDNDGRTALMRAAEGGGAECVVALLGAGADAGLVAALGAGAAVNAKNANGYTVLMWAVAHGHEGSMRALLAAGADVGADGSDVGVE